jgi:hypothetical protein
MEKAVDAIANKGAITFDPKIRNGDPFRLDRHFNLSIYSGATGQTLIGSSGAEVLIWLFRDQLVEGLSAEIGEDAPGALSYDQREAELGRLSKELLALERQEEALISAAERVGQRIVRRRDADPRAILEVEEA